MPALWVAGREAEGVGGAAEVLSADVATLIFFLGDSRDLLLGGLAAEEPAAVDASE